MYVQQNVRVEPGSQQRVYVLGTGLSRVAPADLRLQPDPVRGTCLLRR